MADAIFKVNGVEMYTDHESLLAEEILKLAKEKGAIPGTPEDYILIGDKGEYKGDNRVNLEKENLFITIPDKPTLVG